MDFKEIVNDMKDRIPIVDVLMHYGVRLYTSRSNKEYAYCQCPLPTHPKEDRPNNSFNWHIVTNRWRCYHDACKMKGDNWGDCINLVMALDHLNFTAARKKLESWFPNKNPAPHGAREEGKGQTATHHPHISDITSTAVAVKYTEKVRRWFFEIIGRLDGEEDEGYHARLLKAITTELIQNYKAGQAGRIL
jgi:hypothetical protein